MSKGPPRLVSTSAIRRSMNARARIVEQGPVWAHDQWQLGSGGRVIRDELFSLGVAEIEHVMRMAVAPEKALEAYDTWRSHRTDEQGSAPLGLDERHPAKHECASSDCGARPRLGTRPVAARKRRARNPR